MIISTYCEPLAAIIRVKLILGGNLMSPEGQVQTIENERVIEVLLSKHAESVLMMDVSANLTVADSFVLATGNSDVHMKTLEENVTKVLDEEGVDYKTEGQGSKRWILIDAGPVVIHIFSKSGREFYRLESIWGDAPRKEFSEEE